MVHGEKAGDFLLHEVKKRYVYQYIMGYRNNENLIRIVREDCRKGKKRILPAGFDIDSLKEKHKQGKREI